jgi:hypothetical protein
MKILILAREGSLHHAQVIVDLFPKSSVIDSIWREEIIIKIRPDILVTFDEHYCELALCVIKAKNLGIPTVLVRDGIIESRMLKHESCDQYKRNLEDVFLSDLVLCLGKNDKAIIDSWGNFGKSIDLGSPRIDAIVEKYGYLNKQTNETIKCKKTKLLVLSAKKPYFNELERNITIESFKSLISELKHFEDVEVMWRISPDLAKDLKVHGNSFSDFSGKSLHSIISNVDMVITTPSTSIIEAMMFGVPVGVIDFHLEKQLYKAVWRFSDSSAIKPIITQMMNPSIEQVQLQNKYLLEQISNIGNSKNILKEVLEKVLQVKESPDVLLKSLDIPQKDSFEFYESKVKEIELIALRSMILLLDNQKNQLIKRLYSIPFYHKYVKLIKWLKR